eukprot:6944085-Prymnesium_polylepis.1
MGQEGGRLLCARQDSPFAKHVARIQLCPSRDRLKLCNGFLRRLRAAPALRVDGGGGCALRDAEG